MNKDFFLFTRREFLQGMSVAGLALTMPSFVTNTVSAALAPGQTIPGFKDDRILVVVQLGGGNDGLNTVVPYTNDQYYKLRPSIGVAKDKALRLTDEVGLNPGMTGIKELFDSGDLAVVQGVGYPNPERSHFRSMEIWQTASDSDRYLADGWVGRYFDNCCEGRPGPTAAVNVGGTVPQAFSGKSGVGISFQKPENFKWLEGGPSDNRDAFNGINHTSGSHDEHGPTIDFLRHETANAMVSSDKVVKASALKRNIPAYPNNPLAESLKSIATLIAAGLPTRIYYASMTGFDTHANQAGQHDNRLKQFGDALLAFQKDIKQMGAQDRVMTISFSEFGRRVEENASRGTDHGTAGPMFIAGGGIKPGVHGEMPSLTDLDKGDLKHTVDFRSVYGEVLEGWFGADSAKVLGKKYSNAGVMRA
ncbi:DUF1501 domain-containing protein [soil metagenome]